jgi:DNA-binding winged helix-turn-helix (wHTH) protein
MRVRLPSQPFQVLAILLERPGHLVTRDELQKRLWPDSYVDFEHNLNTAINRIREALGDSAESPRFVETVPRRGYRFIAAVELKESDPVAIRTETRPRSSRVWAAVVLAGCALLIAGAWWFHRASQAHSGCDWPGLPSSSSDSSLRTAPPRRLRLR